MLPSRMTPKGLIKIVKCVSHRCHQHYTFIPDRLENEYGRHMYQYISFHYLNEQHKQCPLRTAAFFKLFFYPLLC